ncbi:MAG: hypothetical protein U0528_01580 [Anaerolineae bacterium]|nr:hypothetical protein [Anaerolineae bacterium]
MEPPLKLIRLTCQLIICVCACAVAVILASRLHPDPNPLLTRGIETCSDMPCFSGIVPGITPWQMVEYIAGEEHQLMPEGLLGWNGDLHFEAYNPLGVANTASPSDLNIGWNSQQIGSVREFVLLYGVPCQVQVSRRGSSAYVLIYPSMIVNAEAVAGRISWQSPVVHFSITQRVNNCNLQTSVRKDWLGFRHLRRYVAQEAAS